MEITDLSQLDLTQTYTYADYLLWKLQERVELIKGRILTMSPAPSTRHQKVSFVLSGLFYNQFKKKECQVFTAPFDVRLIRKGKGHEDIRTVVQPDLCVICDPDKLDERGCMGAPDLIVEILSPGNSKKEMKLKFDAYWEAGVREYWIVNPLERMVQIFVLQNGEYIGKPPVIEEMELHSYIFPELAFPAAELFAE